MKNDNIFILGWSNPLISHTLMEYLLLKNKKIKNIISWSASGPACNKPLKAGITDAKNFCLKLKGVCCCRNAFPPVFPLIKIWGLISHFLLIILLLLFSFLAFPFTSSCFNSQLKQDCFHLSPVKQISDRPFFFSDFSSGFPFHHLHGNFQKLFNKEF